ETGIHILQARETFNEKARVAEQHQRKRDFGDDQSVAQTIAPRAYGRTSATFLKCLSKFRPRAGQTRSETKNNSRADANCQRYSQHNEIDIHFVQPRHSLRTDCFQYLNAP